MADYIEKIKELSIFTVNSQSGLVDDELKVYRDAKIAQRERLPIKEEFHEDLRTVFNG